MQPDLWYLQVRIHQGRLLHQLHLRRQGLLRYPAILLQLPLDLLRVRLLLLHLVQQHADLLRQLLSRLPKPWDLNAFETRPQADIGGDVFFCAADVTSQPFDLLGDIHWLGQQSFSSAATIVALPSSATARRSY